MVSSSVNDILAISDHALSSGLPMEGVLSDRVIAADCALPVSEFAQEARCAGGSSLFSFCGRLPVLMEAVDDEMVVRVSDLYNNSDVHDSDVVLLRDARYGGCGYCNKP